MLEEPFAAVLEDVVEISGSEDRACGRGGRWAEVVGPGLFAISD